jgi:hypothetical protein
MVSPPLTQASVLFAWAAAVTLMICPEPTPAILKLTASVGEGANAAPADTKCTLLLEFPPAAEEGRVTLGATTGAVESSPHANRINHALFIACA